MELILKWDELPKNCQKFLLMFNDWKERVKMGGIYEFESLLKPPEDSDLSYYDMVNSMTLYNNVSFRSIELFLFKNRRSELKGVKK